MELLKRFFMHTRTEHITGSTTYIYFSVCFSMVHFFFSIFLVIYITIKVLADASCCSSNHVGQISRKEEYKKYVAFSQIDSFFYKKKKLYIFLEMLNWWMAFCNLNPHLLLFYAAAVAQEMRGETRSVGWRTSSSSSRYLGAEFRFWWGGRMDRALILGFHKTCRHFSSSFFLSFLRHSQQ